MTDTETDSQPSRAGDEAERSDEEERRMTAAAGDAIAPARTDMTVAEVRQWLRNWIAGATDRPADQVDEATPMVELGLSSRDAVAMAADIEDRTGVTVSIAAAFEHPTIESLASWIVEGDPEIDDTADDTDWTRSGPIERVDIAVVGPAT
jgi:polyketide synthase 13